MTEESPASSRGFLGHPLVTLAVVALSGSVAPLAPGPAATVALVTSLAFTWSRRTSAQLSRRAVAGALLSFATVFLLCGARATGAQHRFERDYFRLRLELPAPSRCAGVAEVTQSPVVRHGQEDGAPVTIWSGTATKLDCEGTIITRPVPVRLYGGPEDLSRDDRVTFVAQLGATRLFRNRSLPDPWPGAARRGSLLSGSALHVERLRRGSTWRSHIDRFRAQVRARILATYSPLAAPLGRALVLGENDLEAEDAEAFRNSGLLHLLAVSGTHLVIAVLALVNGLGAILVRIGPLARRYDVRRSSAAAGAILSLLYADFSGGSGSAWRAAFMLCVVCGGRSLGLKIGGSAALGASLLIGLTFEPLAGSDYSFLLSALATSGLIGLGQPLARVLDRGVFKRAPLRQLTVSFIATISSTLPCAPVLALIDGDMTWAALFANVVAGPFGELIALPACLLHSVVPGVPALEQGLALLGSGALHAVRAIALWSASVEVAQFPVPFPSPWTLALVASGLCLIPLLFAALGSRTRLCAGLCLLTFSVVLVRHIGRGPGPEALSITALDVGQGDALLIDFPDGRLGLLDGGGFATGTPDTGSRVLLPVLRARGRTHIDVMILSHPHPDHMSGLLTVATQISIGQLWVPHLPTPQQRQYADFIAAAQDAGAAVRTADDLCGRFTWGGATLDVVAPCIATDEPMGENDASLVIRLTHGKHRALLTGDIERLGETTLLQAHPELLAADLLKVAHHGSDTSSMPAFVRAVSPRYALISSGVRNRFRHPRPETLQTLSAQGVAILRTDRLGSLTWTTDGKRQHLRSFSSHPPATHGEDFHREVYPLPSRSLSLALSQPSSPYDAP